MVLCLQALLYTTFAGVGGDSVAEMTLAHKYHLGIGVTKNCDESVYYYQRVADKGTALTDNVHSARCNAAN